MKLKVKLFDERGGDKDLSRKVIKDCPLDVDNDSECFYIKPVIKYIESLGENL